MVVAVLRIQRIRMTEYDNSPPNTDSLWRQDTMVFFGWLPHKK